MAKAFLVALILATLATPAHATRGPVSANPSDYGPLILAKNKAEKESASENKPVLCRPVFKPTPEGRVSRAPNCAKPRPILM